MGVALRESGRQQHPNKPNLNPSICFSDDEDWSGEVADSTLYLMSGQISLPRPTKTPESPSDKSLDRNQKFSRYLTALGKIPALNPGWAFRYSHADLKFSKSFDDDYHKPSSSSSDIAKYLEKPVSKFSDNKYLQRQKSMVKERGKEDFRKSLERDLQNRSSNRYLEKSLSNSEQLYDEDRYYYSEKSSPKYFEDDGFDENIR